MNLSICICTYNRCGELDKTLQSLYFCENELLAGDEIIVVDNNSLDKTKDIVLGYQSKLPIRYIFEQEQGLSCARNAGLNTFSNSIVIFFDDDITLIKGTLSAYRKSFSDYASIGFFGGKIFVDWSGEKPYWYQSDQLPMINGLVGNYNLGSKNLQIRNDFNLPYGANFALTRSVIKIVGLFDTSLGVKGEEFERGEETDYFTRAISNGFQGMYIADAQVGHRFQKQRINLSYLYKYGINKGKALYRVNQQSGKLISKIMYQLFAGCYQLLKFRLDRFYQCVINIGVQRGIYIAANDFERKTK